MIELLPCPFCGSKAEIWHGLARCTSCDASTSGPCREKTAAERWNRRARVWAVVVEGSQQAGPAERFWWCDRTAYASRESAERAAFEAAGRDGETGAYTYATVVELGRVVG